MNLAAIVMAAGMGTRMKSDLPKVLHPLLDKPLLSYILEAVQALRPVQTVVVVGYQAEQITAQFSLENDYRSLAFAIQAPQLGTGHAVQQAHSLLKDDLDLVLVAPADLPLLTAPTFQKLVEACHSGDTPLVMLTVESENPRGFGRIVRDEQG